MKNGLRQRCDSQSGSLRLALGEDALIRHGEALLTVSQSIVACDAVTCLRALRTQQYEPALALGAAQLKWTGRIG
jgi:hypothetical protein